MDQQTTLPLAVRVVPVHVLDQVDPYTKKVHVIDGQYHRYAGNVHGRDPFAITSKRTIVVGARMRCGAAMDDPAFRYEWAHRPIRVEQAHQIALPCPRCFRSAA